MLNLDDPAWSRLEDAYGSASGIPARLQALAKSPQQQGPQDEPWFGVWSGLCHQGDVYTASYAAVPHIVNIALTTPGPIDFNFFLLPAAIEVAWLGGAGPDVPADLAADYSQAILDLVRVVAVHLNETWDSSTTRSVVAALAVAKGDTRLAAAIVNLDDELIEKVIALDFTW